MLPKPKFVSRTLVWRASIILLLVLVGVTGLVGALGAGSATNADVFRAAPYPASELTRSASAKYAANGALVERATAAPATPAAHGASAAPGAPASSEGAAAQSALIEETGTMSVVVPASRIPADVGRLMTMAASNGGFVASTETQSAAAGSPAQGTVTLEVPEPSFNAVVALVRGIGRVTSETTAATDVTGQYVDLQAQITALQDSRQQYITIMTRATTIGAVLAVQSQLDNLQSQLNQLEGQLKVLDSETTYATLVVTLSQRVVVPPPPRPESGLVSAWHAAVSGFVAGVEGVIRVAGPLLFALLLLAVVVLVGRFTWKLRGRTRHEVHDGSALTD